MNDYTPILRELQDRWEFGGASHYPRAEFDRTITKVRAAAKAEALREAADAAEADDPRRRVSRGSLADWLRARADEMAAE